MIYLYAYLAGWVTYSTCMTVVIILILSGKVKIDHARVNELADELKSEIGDLNFITGHIAGSGLASLAILLACLFHSFLWPIKLIKLIRS